MTACRSSRNICKLLIVALKHEIADALIVTVHGSLIEDYSVLIVEGPSPLLDVLLEGSSFELVNLCPVLAVLVCFATSST